MLPWKVLCLLLACVVAVRGDGGAEHAPNEGEHKEAAGSQEGSEAEGEEGHEEAHWGYHGDYYPAHWDKLYTLCSRDSPRQSPIDVPVPQTIFDDQLVAVHLSEKIDRRYKKMTMVNNGHSVNVEVPHEAHITGGGLPGRGYLIAGVHFHWGSTDNQGSEHTVLGKAFPLEMHMVSYDTERYATLGDAVFGHNSLAVLGTMFQISKDNNTLFDPIIKGLRKVRQPGSDGSISHFNLGRLLPAHTNKYFRYMGSLTTPPCAESVIWTLFVHTQTISSAQLMELRQLVEAEDEDEGLTSYIRDNWRPVQPLHHRSVFRSFLLKSEVSKPAEEAVKDGAAIPSLSILSILAVILGYLQ